MAKLWMAKERGAIPRRPRAFSRKVLGAGHEPGF